MFLDARFSVHVVDPDTRVPYKEHKTVRSGNKTECYIESVSGVSFALSCDMVAPEEELSENEVYVFDCFIHTKHVTCRLVGAFPDGVILTHCILEGFKVSATEICPFKFADTPFCGILPTFLDFKHFRKWE
jgi:hypothetical protein